jgi:hypothetical protein
VGRYEDILWYSLGEDVKETTIYPLSPKYCDVIIKRWETLTGDKAVLNG